MVTQKRPRRQPGESRHLERLAVHPSGYLLITATYDQILLWDVNGGQILRRLDCEGQQIWGIAVDVEGRTLLVLQDQTVHCWDIATGRVMRSVEVPKVGRMQVAFTKGGLGRALTTHGASCWIWDLSTGTCLHELEGGRSPIASVKLSKDADRVIVRDEAGFLHVWDAESGALLGQWPQAAYGGGSLDFAFVPERSLVLSTTLGETTAFDYERGVRVWSAVGPSPRVSPCIVHPSGDRAVMYAANEMLEIWDLVEGKVVQQFPQIRDRRLLGAFCGDGRRLVVRAERQTRFHVIDIESGHAALSKLNFHGVPIEWIAPLPDGRRLVTGAKEEPIAIWDLETLDLVGQLGEAPLEATKSVMASHAANSLLDFVLVRLDKMMASFQSSRAIDNERKRRASYLFLEAYRSRAEALDVSPNDLPTDVWNRLFALLTEIPNEDAERAQDELRRMVMGLPRERLRLIPHAGDPETVIDRILDYLFPHIPSMHLHSRPYSDEEIARHAVLLGLGETADALPPSYLAFARAMGRCASGFFNDLWIEARLPKLRKWYEGPSRPAINPMLPIVALGSRRDDDRVYALDLRTPSDNPPVGLVRSGEWVGTTSDSWENLLMLAAMLLIEFRRLSAPAMYRGGRFDAETRSIVETFCTSRGLKEAWPSDSRNLIFISEVASLFVMQEVPGQLLLHSYGGDRSFWEAVDTELAPRLGTGVRSYY